MKIHFTSSNSKEALSLKSNYCELYNQANLREADVIVAIGGDGEMLKALRLAIKNNSSVFGLNKGHIGFLMNKINKTNLIKRINKASQLTVHPLEMECFDHKGKKQTFLGINEISLFRNTNQSSIISISVDGVERLRDLYCDVTFYFPIESCCKNIFFKKIECHKILLSIPKIIQLVEIETNIQLETNPSIPSIKFMKFMIPVKKMIINKNKNKFI